MRSIPRVCLFSLLVLISLGLADFSIPIPQNYITQTQATQPAASANTTIYMPIIYGPGLRAPRLKWQRAGCYSSWCETGWYSSPAAADIDLDGKTEVVTAAYSIWAVDGATGALKWRSGTNNSREWPDVALADINQDGHSEIVTANGDGYVEVRRSDGSVIWSRRPSTYELRGLALADLDKDGNLEVIVTAADANPTNTWVYSSNGNLLSGWPQMVGNNGSAWGVYNTNVAAGDLNGDGYGELVIPSDVHSIAAYDRFGQPILANAMYGANPLQPWSAVGVWESLTTELRGWGLCDGVRAESYRPNFADAPAVITDVNHDGRSEVVVTGNVYDCSYDPYRSRYMGVFIFNADRSRFNSSGYDWTLGPVDTGAPLAEDYNRIETAEPNPVAADIDGDGNKEILYPSYDGRLHAFWLDKSEHGHWPFAVTHAQDGYISFASEPVVADLDGDGHVEVIFASWTEKGSHASGKLYVLSSSGDPLFTVDLPAGVGEDWNGSLAAPTLADIDGDNELEVVLNTANSGLVAYDLPGATNSKLIWPTGRGNYLRNGSVP
jgi:hypothetical protein